MVSNSDIYWLAGLLEGEGCFYAHKSAGKTTENKCKLLIQLVMTDRDIVDRAAKIMGTTVYNRKNPPSLAKNKQVYVTRIFGNHAAAWMMTLFRLMGDRRRVKIEACLSAWKAAPGKSAWCRGKPMREETKAKISARLRERLNVKSLSVEAH